MLRLADGSLVLAATDLTNHLACAHLTQQQLAIARGERGRPRPVDDPHAELARSHGEVHEHAVLARLSDECGGCVDLDGDERPSTREALEAAAATTVRAMRDGAPLIYQAQFFDGRWQGRADFLRRIDQPSRLGDHAYEVLDTKLARELKPYVVHQLALYNRLLAQVQGFEPTHAHVLLGDGSSAEVDLRRYAALHRHVVARLQAVVAAPAQPTYPEPVEHCRICALAEECRARRVADDHLSLVANARRDQRERLVELGIPTVLALAGAPEATNARPLTAERFSLLHHQAALQVASRDSGLPVHRHLAPARAAGYALLPDPSPGDVFFDLEGDPYVGDGGLEYLWGWWTAESGYECAWAHDADAEKAAFERFVDCVVERRERHPDMHVFHYAPHERSKLRSLSIQYATREDEVDALLRGEVLVDLYAVVRQGLQVGEESYSLKALERHHGFMRLEKRVREGGGSIVAYERWLETGEGELLEAIRAYNEEDCRSTLSLRDWLLEDMRPQAEAQFSVDFDDYRGAEDGEEHGPPAWMPGVEALIGRLTEGLSAEGADDTPEQAERRLLSHLLLYHHRESKPVWWRYFDLRGKPVSDLLDDRDAVAGLVRDESVPPVPYKRSLDYTFTFPAQEFRLDVGDAEDPTTREAYKVVAIEEDRVVLRRGQDRPPPAPVALVDGGPIGVGVLRDTLVELAESVRAGDGRFAAARAMLRRERPHLASGHLGEDVDALVSATLGLERSVLPVQGPPGTGKTFRGARMVVAALAAGRRVGITAPSHAAIKNLLVEIERCAHAQGQPFTGIYKGPSYDSPHGLVEHTDDNGAVDGERQLVAGTAWLFARTEHRGAFDLLFVDEAGQYSLANAAVAGAAASSVVLLGDPQQLPQVTQADHPDGSGASVLEHLLDGAGTIAPGQGVLLTESWRMHPDVCAFVSERSYDSRLRSRAACATRALHAPAGAITGTGLRALAVEHEGRSQASPEEAETIAAACRDLLAGATVTDEHGEVHPLTANDILVVAPYNLAVRCIRDRIPDGVRVGTVDRFQGQQAPVVFYAMTCSSSDDVPRGIDFLFDDHRLNVAISRAECTAVLVHSPRLLDADCRSLRAMELVDGVCRFVEMAEAVVRAASLTARSRPASQAGKMCCDRGAELGFPRLAALSIHADEFTEKRTPCGPNGSVRRAVWIPPKGVVRGSRMTDDRSVVAQATGEIVAGNVSGGTNTSHTIIVGALAALLEAVPVGAPASAYEDAALEANATGKETEGARRRTYRYLRELYFLRPDSVLFRALRDLWPVDAQAQPLLAGLCALARDAVFRASSSAITGTRPGDSLSSADLAEAVGEQFPESYGAATLAKIGRNTFSSWEQSGHLAEAEHATKVRKRATCRPANVAYALLLGHVEGVRGRALFDTVWAQVLDQPTSHLTDLAASASQDGLLELRQAGGVIDVGFRELLRPFETQEQDQVL